MTQGIEELVRLCRLWHEAETLRRSALRVAWGTPRYDRLARRTLERCWRRRDNYHAALGLKHEEAEEC